MIETKGKIYLTKRFHLLCLSMVRLYVTKFFNDTNLCILKGDLHLHVQIKIRLVYVCNRNITLFIMCIVCMKYTVESL